MKRSGPSRRLEVVPHKVVVLKTAVTKPQNSPEVICVICLDRVQEKCYLNNCLHQFCFSCLEKWSEVKSVCPLCQQKFEYVLHNVRSDGDYDMHVFSNVDVESSPFRVEEREQLPVPERQREVEENSYVPTHIIMVDFRRYVYEHRLLSMPVCGTNRSATCTPQYIRSHQQQVRLRLIPWLNRELGVVISVAHSQLARATEQILSISGQWHMLSSEFRSRLAFCIKEKTDLFSWELYNFTASFCSMIQFDEEARYVVPSHLEVPSHFQQFCASVGTTNPMLSLVGPSLALSPTVQSPVRNLPSPVGSSSDSDSEGNPSVSLHFKMVKHQESCGGVELDSLRCEGPVRDQTTRCAKYYTPIGGWSSDTLVSDSENTSTARVQHKKKKKKKLKRREYSRIVTKLKLGTKNKSSKRKRRKRNKGNKKSVREEERKETISSNVVETGSSKSCTHNIRGVERDQDIPSWDLTNRQVTINLVQAGSASFSKNKRTHGDSSLSEYSDVNNPLSVYRERCKHEAPLSYYHGGFVPISYITGDSSGGHTSSYTSGVEKFDSKRKLSSVVVKPASTGNA